MNKIYLVLILSLTLSIGAAAQKKSQAQQIQANTSLQAQLQQSLDVKNAKVGDEVVLKVSKAVKQNGETIIPKGANLIGRVTEVQKRSKNNADSKLGVVFDRLQSKDLNAPINAGIVSIFQAAGGANVGDAVDADVSGSSVSSGGVSRGNSGGGLLSGVGNTVGGVTNSAGNTVNGVTNTAGNAVGGATQTLGKTVDGIRITQSANVSAGSSTVLSSSGKDIKLDKGVTFNLMLSEAAQVN